MKKFGVLCLVLVLSAVLMSGCGKGNEDEMAESSVAGERAESGMTEAGAESAEEVTEETAESSATEATKETAESGAAGNDTAEKSGDMSPQITFEGVDINGNEISSDVFAESKLTMVNVWATYCNPCLREMPGLGELAAEYDAGEFQIIGIISDVLEESDEDMMQLAVGLIEQTGADYPHLLLNESVYYALLTDVSAVPTTFFVDEKGVVLDIVIGSMEKAAWEEKISELLGK